MDFFKDLNVLEILKIGAIGLGFLLALMSYNLIKKEQEKPKPSNTILRSAKGFMIFSIILMLLGIISEFIKTKPNLHVRLGNNEIELNEISYASLSSLDTKKYFINSEYGFAIKKPNNDWSNIEVVRGVGGLLKIMAVKSKFFTEENLQAGFKQNPLGPLFLNASYFYFYNHDSRKNIIITDSTGNDLIDAVLKQRSKELLDTSSFSAYDTTKLEAKKEFYDELNDNRRTIIGFDTAEIKVAFLLSVFPKDSLPVYLKKLKLPAFYTSYSVAMGLSSDKLVANNNQILSGAELTLKNVKVGNKILELQSKKWFMLTENDKYFFVIELSYSPQISSSTNLWDDLQETLNSFTLLTEK
jgi:hypothetical protein